MCRGHALAVVLQECPHSRPWSLHHRLTLTSSSASRSACLSSTPESAAILPATSFSIASTLPLISSTSASAAAFLSCRAQQPCFHDQASAATDTGAPSRQEDYISWSWGPRNTAPYCPPSTWPLPPSSSLPVEPLPCTNHLHGLLSQSAQEICCIFKLRASRQRPALLHQKD